MTAQTVEENGVLYKVYPSGRKVKIKNPEDMIGLSDRGHQDVDHGGETPDKNDKDESGKAEKRDGKNEKKDGGESGGDESDGCGEGEKEKEEEKEQQVAQDVPEVVGHADEFDIIRACVSANMPVLLRGETGTGKTTSVRRVAMEDGKTLTRINLNGQTGREEILGRYIIIEGNLIWQPGPFLVAWQNGHYILLDEINAALPEVLLVLQAALERQHDGGLSSLMLAEKDGEIVEAHPDTRIFATCNPVDYAGVKDFNSATLSRFVLLDILPLPPHEEEKLLLNRYDVKKEDVAKLIKIADEMRKMKKAGEVSFFVSTRDLEQACILLQSGISLDKAVRSAIVCKSPSDFDLTTTEMAVRKIVTLPKSSVRSYADMEKEYKDTIEKYKKDADLWKEKCDELQPVQEMLLALKGKIS